MFIDVETLLIQSKAFVRYSAWFASETYGFGGGSAAVTAQPISVIQIAFCTPKFEVKAFRACSTLPCMLDADSVSSTPD
jgi:hypothetical protein